MLTLDKFEMTQIYEGTNEIQKLVISGNMFRK